MKRIFIFLIAFSFFATKIYAQNLVSTCTTDTIKLNAANHQYGTLEWESSVDNINWTKIPNAHNATYKFKPLTSAYYRVANKFPYCEPIYSSVTFVQTKPKAYAGKDRIVNDPYLYLSGNTLAGASVTWSVLEGIGGVIEQPTSSYTKFSGFPSGTSGSNGSYKLLYKLQNGCGISTDTLNVKFIQNQYYNKLVAVDNTDIILSTPTQIQNGEYIITFNTPVPVIDNQTILIGMVGDGFMRKVDSFTQNGNTFTMTTSQAKIEEVINKGGIEIGQLYNVTPINENLKMSNYHKLTKIPTRAELLSNQDLKKGSHYFVIDERIESPLKGVSYDIGKNSANKTTNTVTGNEFINYNFNNTTLYNQNGINATLDGNIAFSPNIIGNIDIDWLNTQVTKANIGVDNATFQFHSKLNITATASSTAQPQTITLSTIHKTLLLIIGGVPTLIKIKTQLNATFNANTTGSVSYINEYDKTYTVSAGIVYDNGTWSHYFNQNQSSSISNNITAQATVTGSLDIGPKIFFTINGIAGPYVDTNMTSDLELCASTQNLQNFNWQANLDLGAKLTLGIHAYLFKKKLFDKNKTWENRKLFNERTPYLMEYISGNNQQYTLGQALPNPLKIRVLSKNGFYANHALVTFEVLDNSGALSQTNVWTNSDGIAQTNFTPSASGVSKVQAYVKDCEFNYIQYAPLIFTATQNAVSTDCSQTTLSASFYKNGNTLTPLGHLGVLPYTYSTDFYTFSSVQPTINVVAGQNHHAIVKDANGCVAFAHYYQSTNSCTDSNLEIDINTYGNNAVASAQGGNPPYLFALDNGAYGSTSTFGNLTVGDHLFRVKDSNGCVRQSIVNITNSVSNLIAYFEVPQTINANQPISFNNLSTNATSYSWNFGNGQTSTSTSPSITYAYNGTYTVTLTAYNGVTNDTFSRTIVINNGITTGTYPPNYVHCNGTPTAVVDVVSPVTGRTWMDRNLGASQAATSASDALAYGDLYQWGRFADGHQCRNSNTTNVVSNTANPNHGNFILTNSLNWLSPENGNLWQWVNGINNPCPAGYRIPTVIEVEAERSGWSTNDANGAFNSPLKLPLGGQRDRSTGNILELNTGGAIWTHIPTILYYRLNNSPNAGVLGNVSRAFGTSVRCIKD